jgi:hypothetical protein
MDFDEIADQQGWNLDSMISVLRGFISQDGASDRLNEYAQSVADEENRGWE